MVFGHSQLVNDFKNLAKAGRLGHGYVFFGEPEVGKFYFAKHLANFLENGEFEISSRPLHDLMIIDSTEDLKTNAIGIESARLIKNFIYKRPAVSSKRTLIIDKAENLTDEAQAAILKITEEPPDSATIILVVNQLENLLPTLLSRMQKIYFGRLSDSEMEEVTRDMKQGTRNKIITDFLFGRPGRAARLLNDDLTRRAEKYAEQFLKISGQDRSKLIKELVDLQKDLTEKENKESMLLDYFFESLILKLRREPVKNAAILKSVLHRLFLIKSYNVNKRLQLEAI